MLLNFGFLSLVAAQAVSARFVMYYDQYHTQNLPGRDVTAGIDHVIISALESTLFNVDPPKPFAPFTTVANASELFDPGTKFLIAIGNWGDTAGFSAAAKDETTRALFAKNVAAMLDSVGADGVDIDWEYPGGNGEDYKKIPNSEKVSEIETFPLLLEAIRAAIGNEKLLTIAVPGKKVDMIAFTAEQGPKIWKSVDFVNLMTYDLMNRRDTVTNHHSSVTGSLEVVENYLAIGLDAKKMNLGFPFYAKWFTTADDANCEANSIGCATALLENPADGADTGKSGALTLEKGNMTPALKNLPESTDGTCGPVPGTRCAAGVCCSQYGNCGETDEFCGLTCLPGYGDCPGPTITKSWLTALEKSKTDAELGGEYYYDSSAKIFWTWDTPDLIAQKFEKIVTAKGLGGVMAWSLVEDSDSWEHITAMKDGLDGSARYAFSKRAKHLKSRHIGHHA